MFVCPKCRSIYSTESEFCGIDGTRLIESEEDPLIGLVIDRYRITARLGTGAMGYVYLGQHELLDSRRAFKLLFGELAADRRAMNRFQREAQALSKIRHPNIVSVVDFGTTPEGMTFLAMEYVEGLTLEQLLKNEGKLTSARAASFIRQISAGLAEAHKLGFVHRDLKPGNVMITKYDDTEQVKVLDFGLVAIADDAESMTRLTKTGYTLGTPRYLAPEQSQSAQVTASADLYSLGVILYEMLSGAAPFVGDMKTVIMQHLCETPPALPFADGLEVLAHSLLEKEPAHRPESAFHVVKIIDELAGKIDGSDGFLSLRAISDPRGALTSPRRVSTPSGLNAGIDGETLERLAADPGALRGQNSWAPQLPLNDPATSMTGPSLELISQFPRPEDNRLIQHPKKIAALVVLLLLVATIGMYIGNELGWFTFRPPSNIRRPVFVAPAPPPPPEKPPVEPMVVVETVPTPLPKKAKSVQVAQRPAPKPTRTESTASVPARAPTPEKLSAEQLTSFDKELRVAMGAKGLKPTDLKTLPDVVEFLKRWRSVRKESATDAKAAHAELLRAIKNVQVSHGILQKRLKDVHANLVRASESRVDKSKVSAFEEEYLNLDGKVRTANTPKARQSVAVEILRLDILINRSIQASAR